MERPEVVGTEEGQGGESSVLGKQFWREHRHWTLSHPSLPVNTPLSLHLQITFAFQYFGGKIVHFDI